MRKHLFDQLIESVKEAKAVQPGRRKPSRVTRAEDVLKVGMPGVTVLRSHLKLSQAKFATLLGISTSTLQNWEQHRRKPEGPAKVLRRVAAAHPEVLLSIARGVPRRRARRAAA